MQSTMPQKNPLLLMTPAAFELYVRGILKREKFKVQDLVVNHLENVEGTDGEYVMDVVATFTVFGAAVIRCLIECKRYTNPIEREKVMILQQKLQSTGCQKGLIFSTSEFQSGAIEFAKTHGIALVHVQWGKKMVFVTNAKGDETPPPSEEDILIDSWTAELMTERTNYDYPFLGRDDIFPGENLKAYLQFGNNSVE
jgi:restriction system protein